MDEIVNNIDHQTIRITVVLGTSRPYSYTSKALIPILDQLAHRNIKFDFLDPCKLNLLFPGIEGVNEDAEQIKNICSNADGIIFSTPEYHGSISACAKLIIENLGFPSVLSGKPIVILGIAAGSDGAIKSLDQLRCVLSHIGALVLPGGVSVANVKSVFNKDGVCLDKTIEDKLRGLANILIDFIDR